MRCLLILLAQFDLLLWHTASARFLDEECALLKPSELEYRVSSGHRAEPGTTPWMATVSNQHGFLCGGTLITKSFVLTAAHCIDGQSQLFVRLGIYDRSCTIRSCRGVENYNISRAIIHADFDLNQYTNDVGLLKLGTEVQFKGHIRPICIVMDDSKNLRNINGFTAFGWGKTLTGRTSQLLMAISLYRRVPEECHYRNMLPITEKQICAGSAMGDTCRGDSGGPLATIMGDRYVQVGMVSYGTKMCNASGIYMDVTSYRNWIASNTRTDKPSVEADYDGDNSIGGALTFLCEACFDIPTRHTRFSKQPWRVYNEKYTFAGAVITDRYVVTAASALRNYSPSNLKLMSNNQMLFVESIIKHPEFEKINSIPESFVNDIALIRLTERVLFKDTLRPICVGPIARPQKGLTVLFSASGVLSQEPMKPIDPYVCERSIGRQVESDQFCTERAFNDNLRMQGEVVGTIGKIGDTYKYYLSGILIFKNDNVTVFTHIEYYHQWIQKTILLNNNTEIFTI